MSPALDNGIGIRRGNNTLICSALLFRFPVKIQNYGCCRGLATLHSSRSCLLERRIQLRLIYSL